MGGSVNFEYLVVTFSLSLFVLHYYDNHLDYEKIDSYLTKEYQEYLLKYCFYDSSFKKDTLADIEKMMHLMKLVLLEKRRLPVDDDLPDRLERLRGFRKQVVAGSYIEKLAAIPAEQRKLDDWDLF